jgi:hypothetical protein
MVLIGSLSMGALTSCSPGDRRARSVSTENVYTNDYFISGAGYYHAPYRRWFQMPYNYYDPAQKAYFHGGLWTPAPHESITNISSPTPEAVQQIQAQQAAVRRGGFGHTGSYRPTWS